MGGHGNFARTFSFDKAAMTELTGAERISTIFLAVSTRYETHGRTVNKIKIATTVLIST